uniref:NAD(P)(+)--arginine ADP-ribosyltransferase n=1 Tax=Chelonoidis abingdonii TaxID=106734 RepID=A0A8C0J145_CHEAB
VLTQQLRLSSGPCGLSLWECQVELRMMDDAFDDQYIGCAEEMDGIAPELLEKEKSMSSVFSRVWENSGKKWELVKKKICLPRGFKDERERAIIAYTDNDFHSELNAAVREAGISRAQYMASFQFKAFHYYLTRGSVRFQQMGSDHIRFGYFASSSFDIGVAKRFGMDTLFIIHIGVEIRAFSYIQEVEEELIPVHEIFNMPLGQGSNSFVLRSTNRTCSHFNCAYLGGEYWAEHKKYLCGAILDIRQPLQTPSGKLTGKDKQLNKCIDYKR